MGAVASPPTAPETLIQPPARWGGFGLSDLWQYRELLYFLMKRELQIRYKQSVFGVAWAVLQPLAYALVFTLVFSHGAGLSSEGVPYPVFTLAALAPWLFFSRCIAESAASLVNDSNLVTKVYFPRLVLPIGRILSFSVDLAIALGIVAVFVVIYDAHPSAGLVMLPLFILLALTAAVGVGTFLAALNVKYRDVAVGVPFLVQLWFFATPVVYAGTLVTGKWHNLVAINPMVTVVDGVRWGFLGTQHPDATAGAISAASALVMLAVGVLYFYRTERFFADIV
jgi:lipopolysaccharide transport system permease protein